MAVSKNREMLERMGEASARARKASATPASPASPSPMGLSGAELERAKAYVKQWETTGPILERLRRQQLRELDYSERRDVFLDLLDLGFIHRRPRVSTGLVEMQRLFMKARQCAH